MNPMNNRNDQNLSKHRVWISYFHCTDKDKHLHLLFLTHKVYFFSSIGNNRVASISNASHHVASLLIRQIKPEVQAENPKAAPLHYNVLNQLHTVSGRTCSELEKYCSRQYLIWRKCKCEARPVPADRVHIRADRLHERRLLSVTS